MVRKSGWRVVVLDDDVNSRDVVVYTLRRLCGMSLADAVTIMWRIHVTGSWEVGVFAAQGEAEELAARLQVAGLHGAVREAR